MLSKNDYKAEKTKIIEAYTDDSKKYEILMKKGIEGTKLMFQMVEKEEPGKKIYCSLYNIETLKHMEILSPYNSIDEIFFQNCD